MTGNDFVHMLIIQLSEANRRIGELEAEARLNQERRNTHTEKVVVDLLRAENIKLNLIKLVRATRGTGLGDSKAIVENSDLWNSYLKH
jgi:ribosomal protein L7/L12